MYPILPALLSVSFGVLSSVTVAKEFALADAGAWAGAGAGAGKRETDWPITGHDLGIAAGPAFGVDRCRFRSLA